MVDLVRLLLFDCLQRFSPALGLPPHRAGRHMDVSHLRQDVRYFVKGRLPT
jgi:hypothetical protein